MRLIDRYIFREVFSHALLGLAVFTFVFFVPQLVRLMELVVRHSADAGTALLLFLCTLPGVLTFTVPMAVLVGVLIGLGRMSGDSEVIALHAVGIGLRRLLVPVGVLALATGIFTLLMTVWLGPLALRTFRDLENRLRTTQASFQVQPRVFDERFPRMVLYVQDVEALGTRWRGIFLAESGSKGRSQLTLAESAIVIADPSGSKVQFHLRNGATHEYDPREPDRYSVSTFGESDLPVAVAELPGRRTAPTSNGERSLAQLLAVEGAGRKDALVELHRRLAFPAACLVFALLGVPVGARPRRGGRAAGFVVTLALICGYYLLFVSGAGMARRGVITPALGIWAANLLTALLALALLPRMEQVRAEGILTRWTEALADLRRLPAAAGLGGKDGRASTRDSGPAAARPQGMGAPSGHPPPHPPRRATVVSITPHQATPARRPAEVGPGHRAGPAPYGAGAGFPLLIDLYLLRSFFAYGALTLAGFLILFDSFTFFELLEDIGRHNTPMMVVANYFLYLTPHLVYQLLPLVTLVAALVTLATMAKNNEITALKAAGVSLYRLALPLLGAAVLLAAGMFLLDNSYLPFANQKQDALRNQIKGRPAQTFFQPRRQWIFGENAKIYNYELFDFDNQLFGGLHVYELDPKTFQLRRRVFAKRAHWETRLHTWVLEEGWVRDFDPEPGRGAAITRYVPFLVFNLSELSEPPDYFQREVRQSYQLNWRELRQYIRDLQQAGFDVARLSVQWHRKFSFPLLAPIIVLLAIPFSFLVGTRGALGGIALAVGIAIVYWATSALFEALGAVGQLPPFLAAWSPDAIFAFVGAYFFLKMPT